jgi:hypothetical protein
MEKTIGCPREIVCSHVRILLVAHGCRGDAMILNEERGRAPAAKAAQPRFSALPGPLLKNSR